MPNAKKRVLKDIELAVQIHRTKFQKDIVNKRCVHAKRRKCNTILCEDMFEQVNERQ